MTRSENNTAAIVRSPSSTPETEALPRFVEFVRVSSRGQADRDTPKVQRQALDKLRESRPGVFVERIECLAGISGALPLEERPDV